MELNVDYLQIQEGESSSWSSYSLEVAGQVGKVKVFSNRTELHLNPRCLSTFIQTDKLKYLPGQEVRIRVLSVHPDGKPYITPVDIVLRVSQTAPVEASSVSTTIHALDKLSVPINISMCVVPDPGSEGEPAQTVDGCGQCPRGRVQRVSAVWKPTSG